jgi:hypothetical protein
MLACSPREYRKQHGDSHMRKLASVTVLAGMLASLAMPALAQTTTTPTGPQDCKSTEMWDTATRICKPNV